MTRAALSIKKLEKRFHVSTSGIASVKTMLLWWKRREMRHIHVLKGISFDIERGQCVAVVGRNGAGKSTLLALIARVYKPTAGEIEIEGRIAPLLELGAGFHPDLTGYENIFFNGVILGLTRKQMQERIDEIIEFSELGSHIHQPTRTYSSGMLARLGFAVAVHVDADILIVDEVLAVGDFDFENKCYARIEEFKAKGGTILFVSHDTESILRIADKCVWLHNGHVQEIGLPQEIISRYEAAPKDAVLIPEAQTD
jgi:ABC-type polysaccharide/polyol phosphate transport system ATPase subunit